MKAGIFEASIEQNTNKLYTTTLYGDTVVRNGAFVKMGENQIFYRVEKGEKITIKKKFTTRENKLILKGNLEFKIAPADTLQIFITEQEAVGYSNISPHDYNYKIGEKIYAQGGITSSSRENITGEYACFEVTKLNANNQVLGMSLVSGGTYLVPPSNPVTLMNEDGAVFQVEIEFDISPNTFSVEREVSLVEGSSNETEITIIYDLPDGCTEGELLLTKKIIHIDRPYNNESFETEPCQITFDYSPINGIPLLPPNPVDPATSYNKGVEIIDSKLQEMEKRIVRLEMLNP